MTPLRIVCVDDEPLALRRLQIILDALPEAEMVGAARSTAEASLLVLREKPDVVLLDIQLGTDTGFDLIELLPDENPPQIIFVTAFSQHAVAAFGVDAVDYVLKPVQADRLQDALIKARRRSTQDQAHDQIVELRQTLDALRRPDGARDETGHETEFWIRRPTGDLVRVAAESIERVSVEDDYVRLHVGDRSFLMRETLGGFLRRSPPQTFVRVHRAQAVRRSAVTEIRRVQAGLAVVLSSGVEVPTGRVYAKSLRSFRAADRLGQQAPSR